MGQYDITTAAKAKLFLGLADTDLQVPALSVYCSAADATAATTAVVGGSLVLVITGGAHAGTTTFSLAAANYASLTLLVTAINATTGWTANLQHYGQADSVDLVNTPATACLGVANVATLVATNNFVIGLTITQATMMLENAIGTHIVARSYTEAHPGLGSQWLYPDNFPVISVERISDDEVGAVTVMYSGTAVKANISCDGTSFYLRTTSAGVVTTTTLALANYVSIGALVIAINALPGWTAIPVPPYDQYPSTDIVAIPARFTQNRRAYAYVGWDCSDEVEIAPDRKRLYNPNGWGGGRAAWRTPGRVSDGFWQGDLNRIVNKAANVHIVYTAGYVTVPEPLESAGLELVQILYNQIGRNPAITNESLGDYSYGIKGMSLVLSASSTEELAQSASMIAARLGPYRRIMVMA
jgi:hypothetical protein